MFLLLYFGLMSPWVESPEFSRAAQAKAYAATVRLTNPATRGEGTAIRIKREKTKSYFLTAAHNLEKTKVVNLEAFDPEKPGEVLRKIDSANVREVWPALDLAILTAFEPEPAPCVALAADTKGLPNDGAIVISVGCGDGLPPEVLLDRLRGKIIGNKPGVGRCFYWQTDRIPLQGRSGGPLLDRRGFVIGVCSGTHGQAGFYVHIDEIQKALKDKGLAFLFQPLTP